MNKVQLSGNTPEHDKKKQVAETMINARPKK